MIIRKPTAEDLPFLSKLWQEAFGDSPEDVENFHETAFSFERALVADEAGAVYWMDVSLSGEKMAYLYAFAVEKACRGKGIGKAILEKALETLKGEGYAGAVLVPGEDSLYAYYQKAGFVPFGKTQKRQVEKCAPPMAVKEILPETYFALRQKAKPELIWAEEAIAYLGRFCRLYVAENGLLALGRDGVQEFVGNWDALPHILYTLNIESVQALAPGENPCAMAYCFEEIALPDSFAPSF